MVSDRALGTLLNKTSTVKDTNKRYPAYAAYAAAVLFAVSLARFFFIPRLGLPANSPILAQLNGGLLPVAAHLLLFPVIGSLPAPSWARAAGYGWLVIDITTDIMALNGVPDTTHLPMRYGGHVCAALWIATSSWRAGGATRIVGLLLALVLGGFSFIPNGPLILLIPSGPLIPIWLALVGRLLTRGVQDTGVVSSANSNDSDSSSGVSSHVTESEVRPGL